MPSCSSVQREVEATTDIQAGIKQTEREIELLHEYHTRLIADLVTGKLDVREAVAKLPTEDEGQIEETDVEDNSELLEALED